MPLVYETDVGILECFFFIKFFIDDSSVCSKWPRVDWMWFSKGIIYMYKLLSSVQLLKWVPKKISQSTPTVCIRLGGGQKLGERHTVRNGGFWWGMMRVTPPHCVSAFVQKLFFFFFSPVQKWLLFCQSKLCHWSSLL